MTSKLLQELQSSANTLLTRAEQSSSKEVNSVIENKIDNDDSKSINENEITNPGIAYQNLKTSKLLRELESSENILLTRGERSSLKEVNSVIKDKIENDDSVPKRENENTNPEIAYQNLKTSKLLRELESSENMLLTRGEQNSSEVNSVIDDKIEKDDSVPIRENEITNPEIAHQKFKTIKLLQELESSDKGLLTRGERSSLAEVNSIIEDKIENDDSVPTSENETTNPEIAYQNLKTTKIIPELVSSENTLLTRGERSSLEEVNSVIEDKINNDDLVSISENDTTNPEIAYQKLKTTKLLREHASSENMLLTRGERSSLAEVNSVIEDKIEKYESVPIRENENANPEIAYQKLKSTKILRKLESSEKVLMARGEQSSLEEVNSVIDDKIVNDDSLPVSETEITNPEIAYQKLKTAKLLREHKSREKVLLTRGEHLEEVNSVLEDKIENDDSVSLNEIEITNPEIAFQKLKTTKLLRKLESSEKGLMGRGERSSLEEVNSVIDDKIVNDDSLLVSETEITNPEIAYQKLKTTKILRNLESSENVLLTRGERSSLEEVNSVIEDKIEYDDSLPISENETTNPEIAYQNLKNTKIIPELVSNENMLLTRRERSSLEEVNSVIEDKIYNDDLVSISENDTTNPEIAYQKLKTTKLLREHESNENMLLTRGERSSLAEVNSVIEDNIEKYESVPIRENENANPEIAYQKLKSTKILRKLESREKVLMARGERSSLEEVNSVIDDKIVNDDSLPVSETEITKPEIAYQKLKTAKLLREHKSSENVLLTRGEHLEEVNSILEDKIENDDSVPLNEIEITNPEIAFQKLKTTKLLRKLESSEKGLMTRGERSSLEEVNSVINDKIVNDDSLPVSETEITNPEIAYQKLKTTKILRKLESSENVLLTRGEHSSLEEVNSVIEDKIYNDDLVSISENDTTNPEIAYQKLKTTKLLREHASSENMLLTRGERSSLAEVNSGIEDKIEKYESVPIRENENANPEIAYQNLKSTKILRKLESSEKVLMARGEQSSLEEVNSVIDDKIVNDDSLPVSETEITNPEITYQKLKTAELLREHKSSEKVLLTRGEHLEEVNSVLEVKVENDDTVPISEKEITNPEIAHQKLKTAKLLREHKSSENVLLTRGETLEEVNSVLEVKIENDDSVPISEKEITNPEIAHQKLKTAKLLREHKSSENVLLTRGERSSLEEVNSVIEDKIEYDDSLPISENEITNPKIAYQKLKTTKIVRKLESSEKVLLTRVEHSSLEVNSVIEDKIVNDDSVPINEIEITNPEIAFQKLKSTKLLQELESSENMLLIRDERSSLEVNLVIENEIENDDSVPTSENEISNPEIAYQNLKTTKILQKIESSEKVLLARGERSSLAEVNSVIEDEIENDDSVPISKNETTDPKIAYQIFKTTKILRKLESSENILLTRGERRFLAEVNSAIEDQIKNDDSVPINENEITNPEIAYQISTVLENISIIISRLQGGRESRKRFIDAYPVWKKTRKDGIEKLKEIAQSINSDRFNCNVSKLVGYSTSLMGAGLALSAILTLGLTTPLAIVGGTITAAGCTTSVGTSVTQHVLLNTKVKNAQEIINEDKKYFKEMSNWLEHAEELEKAYNDLLSIDIVKDIAESVKKLVESGINIINDFERLNHIKISLNEMLSILPRNILGAIPMRTFSALVSVLAALFVLLLNTENCVILDYASVTIRSIAGIASLVDDSMDVFRLSVLFSGSAAATRNIARTVTRGTVAVLGMALDVAGITLTSMDIHNGSLSPEAEKIKKVALELEEEAQVLQKVYENLHPY